MPFDIAVLHVNTISRVYDLGLYWHQLRHDEHLYDSDEFEYLKDTVNGQLLIIEAAKILNNVKV